MPCGGGFGNPLERDPEAVLQDVIDGFVTQEAARGLYRTVITAEGKLDTTASRNFRAR